MCLGQSHSKTTDTAVSGLGMRLEVPERKDLPLRVGSCVLSSTLCCHATQDLVVVTERKTTYSTANCSHIDVLYWSSKCAEQGLWTVVWTLVSLIPRPLQGFISVIEKILKWPGNEARQNCANWKAPVLKVVFQTVPLVQILSLLKVVYQTVPLVQILSLLRVMFQTVPLVQILSLSWQRSREHGLPN